MIPFVPKMIDDLRGTFPLTVDGFYSLLPTELEALSKVFKYTYVEIKKKIYANVYFCQILILFIWMLIGYDF